MRYAAEDGISSDDTSFDDVDQKCMQAFIAFPDLNVHLNHMADEFCGGFIAELVAAGTAASGETTSRFHFEVKKLLLIFTDPDDTEDGLYGRDLSALIVGLHHRLGRDINRVPAALNAFSRAANEHYIPGFKNEVDVWPQLNNHERFWMVYGAIAAAPERTETPDIPTQAFRP